MYYTRNFYSQAAWKAWDGGKGKVTKGHRIESAENLEYFDARIVFDPVRTFSELLERTSFLQLMNKRLVLTFRGLARNYGSDLPSILRGINEGSEEDKVEVLKQRFRELRRQAEAWRQVILPSHPRVNTIKHYPQAIWALQQHYKDLLSKTGLEAATTPFLDVSTSVRVATSFATLPPEGWETKREKAYLCVFGLPQTTGSITFDADEQMQIVRLTAVCSPQARRPAMQDGLLVCRFPLPEPGTDLWETNHHWGRHAEYFSLQRRTIGIIPLEPTNESFDEFWDGGQIAEEHLLKDPWFGDVGRRIRETLKAMEDEQAEAR